MMNLQELIASNTNELDSIYIYYSQDAYDNLEPDVESDGNGNQVDELDCRCLVDSWFMDVNFCLHVLIPYED